MSETNPENTQIGATGSASSGAAALAPAFYCPSCGERYHGPGVCQNMHPPVELRAVADDEPKPDPTPDQAAAPAPVETPESVSADAATTADTPAEETAAADVSAAVSEPPAAPVAPVVAPPAAPLPTGVTVTTSSSDHASAVAEAKQLLQQFVDLLARL